ncbi:MAG: hypothetical protein ACYSXD_09990 [Planctomycetota bacterium]|jgi:hypothetical protein
MSKKLYFLISLILLLSFAGRVSAQYIYWDNDDGAGDRLWDTAVNWSTDTVPRLIDDDDDTAVIDNYDDDSNGPIIQAGIDANVTWLEMGYEIPSPNESVLTMTGGTLTAGGWIDVGGYFGGYYRFDMNGGEVTVIGQGEGTWEGIWLGFAPNSVAVMDMSGGDVNVFGGLWLGWEPNSYADFNMTGGTYSGDYIYIGTFENQGGSGRMDLRGGTMHSGDLAMGEVSHLNISGGVLTCDTDLTVANGWLFDPGKDTAIIGSGDGVRREAPDYTGTLPLLAAIGRVTAYDVNSGDIITDSVSYPAEAGLRALVKIDYDVTNEDMTTVSAAALDPNLAYNPTPFDMERGVSPSEFSTISWSAGTNADQHDVYFGTAETALVFKLRQAGTTYPPDIPYEFGANYFWRIDEVNASGGVEWPGDVWEFTADDHLVVDDMESYVAYVDEIYDTWLDYVAIPTSKAEILLNYSDPNLAIDGNSMEFGYRNIQVGGNKRKYSWTEALASDLGAGTDWTLSGLKALVLNFYGQAGNSAQPMYVVVEDGGATEAMVTYDDANAIQEEEWHEWNIDLEDFNSAGVDLTNVYKITLGIGVRDEMTVDGGTGTVYFDSFELWGARCRPEVVLSDLTGDCATDGYDLTIMATEWLKSDAWVVSAAPTYDPNIWLKFDNGTGLVAINSGEMGTDYNGQLGSAPGVDPCDPGWITTDVIR